MLHHFKHSELPGEIVASYVGDGAPMLVRRALGDPDDEYFFKQALNGFLPDEIINKTKHGFGLPFGIWLESHAALRHIALESLNDLKKRQVVRAKFIDELTAVHVKNHPQYYGTMVWVLMMLEQWLKQHRISLN